MRLVLVESQLEVKYAIKSRVSCFSKIFSE